MNNFTVLGGKFKISAQDSDSEYLCWRCKNSPVFSDLKPPLAARDVPSKKKVNRCFSPLPLFCWNTSGKVDNSIAIHNNIIFLISVMNFIL